MAEIMTQEEIDALLSAIDDGDVSVEEIEGNKKDVRIRDYDFKSPKKLAKDQLKTLSIINDNYSRILNTYISGYLRVMTNINVMSVEELSYYEFNNSVVNPAMIAIINFDPLPGQIIIETSTRVAFTMVDRILGGSGSYDGETRAFTEIELMILSKLIKNIITLLSEPWENVIELEPTLDKIESNSQFVQIVSPNETVALITLSIAIGEVEGLMNICIPHRVLEPILPMLSTNYLFSAGVEQKYDEKGKEELTENLKKAKLPATAIVGETYITVQDFLCMQPGDVIKLDKKVDEELELKVGGITTHIGLPGIFGKKMAFKINKIIDNKDGDDDE